MRTKLMIGAGLVSAIVLAMSTAPAAVASPNGVKVGTLSCDVAKGWGKVIGSNKKLECTFQPNGRHSEQYVGEITKIGVDVGFTRGGTMVWEVIAPTTDVRHGSLAGNYGGVSADATVGLGVGANILVGGLHKSFALQPLSVEGNTGLDLAAGIGTMHLRSA